MKSVVVLLLLAWCLAENPGVKFYVDFSALNLFQLKYLEPVMSNSTSFPLKDFQMETSRDFLPVTIAVTNVKLGDVRISDPGPAIPMPPNRINFELFVTSAVISFNWEISCWPHSSGTGKISLENSHVSTGFVLGESEGKLTIDPEVEVAVGEMKASCDERLMSWLYEAIFQLKKNWLESEVKAVVIEAAVMQLKEKIEEMVGSPVYKATKKSLFVDFSLVSSPVVRWEYMEFATRGAFFDSNSTVINKIDPLPFPEIGLNPSHAPFFAYISLATLQNWIDAAHSNGVMVLPLFPFQTIENTPLTTTFFNNDLPGLVNMYGDRELYMICHMYNTEGNIFINYWSISIPERVECQMRFKGVKEPFGTVHGNLTLDCYYSCEDYHFNMLLEGFGYKHDFNDEIYASVPSLGLENVPFDSLYRIWLLRSENILRWFRIPNIPTLELNWCNIMLKHDHIIAYGGY